MAAWRHGAPHLQRALRLLVDPVGGAGLEPVVAARHERLEGARAGEGALRRGEGAIIRTRTSHYENFTMSGTGYNDNSRRRASTAPSRPAARSVFSARRGPRVRDEGKIYRVDPDFGSTLTVSNRDSQSNCWVNWKMMGQPCVFQVWAVWAPRRRPSSAAAHPQLTRIH